MSVQSHIESNSKLYPFEKVEFTGKPTRNEKNESFFSNMEGVVNDRRRCTRFGKYDN
jgi:hypothetical protein